MTDHFIKTKNLKTNSFDSGKQVSDKNPLVSVVIPCYNQAYFLPESVGSVIAQTYENWELVIINDGSPDNTSEVANELIDKYVQYDIRLIEKENGGISDARNSGIAVANGEYILPLDADDKLTEKAISLFVAVAIRQNSSCVVYGSYEMFGAVRKKIMPISQYSPENIIRFNMIQPASLFSKKVWEITGGYKTDVDGYEDWDFWVNCHRHHIPFLGIKEFVFYYRRIPGSGGDRAFKKHAELKARIICHYPELYHQRIVKRAEKYLTVVDAVRRYKKNPADSDAVATISRDCRELAETWLNLPPAQLENMYRRNIFGRIQNTLMDSGIKDETRYRELRTKEDIDDSEQTLVSELKAKIYKGLKGSDDIRYLLAAMLYFHAHHLPQGWYRNIAIPEWLLEDHIKFLFKPLNGFWKTGEADTFHIYMKGLTTALHHKILSHPNSSVNRKIAQLFTRYAEFTFLYFSDHNLKEIYRKRAEIIAFTLRSGGDEINHTFPERAPDRNKIRLGILANNFFPRTETFSTIPLFDHLDRTRFEIILYALKVRNDPLEQYCRNRADRMVALPGALADQVQTIRADDLDILVVGTNITAFANSITLLSGHRLARIQGTGFSSPVTTGMRDMDFYISGTMTEPPDAQAHYNEKLLMMVGCGYCFNYYALPPSVPSVRPTREKLGIADESVVFISGANFYKILPELKETWTKIIAAVPNSVLLLYPFTPSWNPSYPEASFADSFKSLFIRYGIAPERLHIIRSLPDRTTVKAYLELGDVYLDSCPYTSANAMVDPLETGLPVVVTEGRYLRSRQGAALLREIDIPDLVTDSEDAYIRLAVRLGTDQYLRQLYRQRVQEKMSRNPRFLDSHSYSARTGKLFQELFQEWQDKNPSLHTHDDGISQPRLRPEPQLLTTEFLNRLEGCINLYKIDPSDQSVISKLRKIRRHIAEVWIGIPSDRLERLYKGEAGKGHKSLMKSNLRKESPTEEEQVFSRELVRKGNIEPERAINYLLAAMLYLPRGKMGVHDPRNCLPAWLAEDYETFFGTNPLAIISGLWIGERFSLMERLSALSFLKNGHPYHLYVYGDVKNVPEGVLLKDANEILPGNRIFKYRKHDSFAGFSNIFRYKLLFEKGGYWADTDIVCLRPFDFTSQYVFATEKSFERILCTTSVSKTPAGSDIMKYCYKYSEKQNIDMLEWGQIGPLLLNDAVNKFDMKRYAVSPAVFCPIDWMDSHNIVKPFPKLSKQLEANVRTGDTYAVHLWNELWRRDKLDKDRAYHKDCLYEYLKQKYFSDQAIFKRQPH